MKRFCLPLFLSSLVHSSAAVAVWEVDVLDILPQFSEVGFLPGQGFRAEFFAPDGAYGISFSPDLSAGSFGVPVVVTSVDGIGSYLDASALGRAKGFYRLEGTFQSDAYHLIAPAFALERYDVDAVTSGDLVGEVIAKSAILEYRSEADGGILYDSSGFLFQQYLIPATDTIDVFSGFTDDLVQARTGFPAAGLRVEIPAGGIDLPYGDATRTASVQEFLGFETDRSFLAATEWVEYESVADPEDPDFSFDGTKFAFPFLVKKSLNADAADLEGNWGILNLTVGGFREFENNVPVGPVSAFYGVYASVGTIGSTDVGSGNLNITGQWDFEAVEEFGDPYFAAAERTESLVADQLPFSLSANGAITLTDEFDDPIYGAVSPSASMLVATRAFPDALDDFNTGLGFSEQSLIVAVKRDTSPLLAGRVFRMKTLGFYVNFLTEPGFEMYRGNSEANLEFSADGTTAVLFASQDYRALTLDGGELSLQDFFDVNLDVEVRQDGTIVLTADDSAGFTQLVGFAQEDGEAMVFANTYENNQGYYEVGLMILKEE